MPVQYVFRKLRDFFIYRVLHVDDTPRRIALSVAIGIWVCWTPTMPFQMILTVLLCTLFRANKVVGLPFVWISNPLTIIPVYGPNYILGCWLLGGDYGGLSQLVTAVHAMFRAFDNISLSYAGVREALVECWDAVWKIYLELWVGSLVIATILGVMSYFAMYHAVVVYRRFRHRRLIAKGKIPPDTPVNLDTVDADE